MKQLEIREIQAIELQILRHFHSICQKNNIRYFLSNGTLLGAIKYGGFIPWDDDVDVFVPRDDYKKLIELYQDTAKYKLFSLERCGKYYFPFAKLCDMDTIKYEDGYVSETQLGLCIDIFPLDAWSSPYKKAIKQLYLEQRNISNLQYAHSDYGRGRNVLTTIARNIVIFIRKTEGARRICEKMQKSAECSSGKTVYRGCVVWPIYGEQEIISTDVFNDIVEVVFEGERFPAPIGYDTYLRSLYGNFENDPPIEKQKTHHLFQAYMIDKT